MSYQFDSLPLASWRATLLAMACEPIPKKIMAIARATKAALKAGLWDETSGMLILALAQVSVGDITESERIKRLCEAIDQTIQDEAKAWESRN
jgi:hypothetical protein